MDFVQEAKSAGNFCTIMAVERLAVIAIRIDQSRTDVSMVTRKEQLLCSRTTAVNKVMAELARGSIAE